MASVKTVAKDMLDVARDGIGWIAFWRDGRGWGAQAFWPDFDPEDRRITFTDGDDVRALQEILQKDCSAIFVNSYVHNLGAYEEGTAADLADGLRWQYKLQNYLVADAIA